MKVELFYLRGCPHAEPARELLQRCLLRSGVRVEIEEHEGDYASPSIVIDGVDVMGAPGVGGACCRLDLPDEERVLIALRADAGGGTQKRDRRLAVGSSLGAVGAAAAALLSTLCCAGPVVAAVLGSGGVLAAVWLRPYRVYLLGIATAALAFGFWRTYRLRCAPQRDPSCARPTSRAARAILWVATGLTFVAIVGPHIWP